MKLLLQTIILCLFILSCSTSDINKSSFDYNDVSDKNLIMPGRSAEGFIIGEAIDSSILKSDSLKSFDKDKSFSEILDIDLFPDLNFNAVLYISNSSSIFIKDGIITAIAGFKTERRVTSDGILLSNGIDSFILNYGNSHLVTNSKRNHRVYYFKELGIAVFDDNGDNSIDMFLILKPDKTFHSFSN